MANRQVYEIWLDESAAVPEQSWALQLWGYVARFPSRGAAEKQIEAVKAHRKKEGYKEQ